MTPNKVLTFNIWIDTPEVKITTEGAIKWQS